MRKLAPTERIPGMAGVMVGDFWSWAYSDVLSNANRSVFAEFMVGEALGCLDSPRVEWDAVDLRYRGLGIEVKSSAYLQSWPQTRLSTISYDIGRKRGWDAHTNTYADTPERAADCYVFCLFADTDPAQANVLDVDRWQFYVIAKETIEQVFDSQKSVGLARVQQLCDPVPFAQLKSAVDRVLGLE